MKTGSIHLAGIGSYIPRTVPVAHAVRDGLIDDVAAEESGIVSVAVETALSATDMAVRAAEVAVARSGHRPEDFAALLHCGAYYQGPDSWSAPHHVLDRTLGRPVTALEVRQGCLAMLTSLRLAAALLTAEQDTAEAVLITGGDNFSTPLVDRWRDSEHAMYADSGAALVVSRAGGFAEVLSVVSRSVPELESMHRYGEPLLPPARPAERPLHVGPRLQAWSERPGAGAHDMIEAVTRYGQLVAETAEQGLAEAGIGRSGLARVAHVGFHEDPLHSLLLDSIGIPAKQGTWEFMRTIGHASVSDPVLGLEHLWTTGQVTEGDHVMLLGATEGMEAGCAVVRITTAYDRDA